ncbi:MULTISPECIES: hypothetical protein [Bacillus]|uniref:Uncharacterized protein n=1 Tax=Bacillus mycoides TaxID=1405 RepID=A0A3D9VH92_BACMY|nr:MULTISPECIES: hypothetical protein [Bacillus]RBP27262.1 hypothetical protein DET63_10681 [Bacillus sp. DB-2]REF39550.1 hypothetical protein DET55_105163 [Bacillus mycoides]
MEQINSIVSLFSGRVWPFLAALAPIIAVIITYTRKNNFDLIFETKQTRFLVKITKVLLLLLSTYLIFQIASLLFAYGLKDIKILLSKNFKNFISVSFAFAVLITLIYLALTGIKSLIPNNWIKPLKILSFFTNKTGFFLYFYFFLVALYVQALYYLSATKDLFALKLNLEQINNLFLQPFIIIFFLMAVLYFHNINKGGFKSYNYSMKIVEYKDIKHLSLIHLYTRIENEWVLVEEKDLKKQNVIYLFKRDSDKWYQYTKIESSS